MGNSLIARLGKMSGNAFLHVLWGLSFLVPRDRNKWVVGNARSFNNNTKYFFIHAKTVLSRQKCYWISKSRDCRREVRQRGFKAYHPWSLIGMYHQLTAGVYVYDLRMSAFNFWISGRAKRVNLWHGVGIKNVEFKRRLNMERTNTWSDYLRHPANYMRPDLFLSTSPLMTAHFAACFRIPESRCIESEYPRNVLFRMSREELWNYLNTYENADMRHLAARFESAGRVYIYMPTWREDGSDFLQAAGFDLPALEEALKRNNELFVFKLHPFTKMCVDTSRYRHILFMDRRMDVYPLLPFTDVLVTDYSSIYYDYLLLEGKETLLFPFDYEKYVTNERDLAFDFDRYTPGFRVYTFEELLEVVRQGSPIPNEKRDWVIEQFWKSSRYEDLYEAIGARQ